MIVGNSSAGVREAPIYGVPSLNIGNRQKYRAKSKSIFDRSFSYKEIISVINKKIKDLKLANYLGKVIVLKNSKKPTR